ncbi:hypothetical protein HC928_06455 [bacterium]|nr:hypothetical protein [bacterium]
MMRTSKNYVNLFARMPALLISVLLSSCNGLNALLNLNIISSESSLPSAFGAVVSQNGIPYLIGGWNESGMTSSVLRVQDCGSIIEVVRESSEWEERSYFPAIHINNLTYIFGGFQYIPPSNVLGDVWMSPNMTDWDLVAVDPAWEQREAHGVVFHENEFYLLGGVTYFRPEESFELGKDNPSHLRVFGDVWRSQDGFAWSNLLENAPWGPRRSFSYAVKDGYIYMWGGVNDERNKNFNDVWRSADGVNWEQVSRNTAWSPRMLGNHAPIMDERLWVIGGNSDAEKVVALNDVWSSDDGLTWELMTEDAEFPARHGAFVFTLNCNDKSWIGVYGGINDFHDQDRPDRTFYKDLWVSKDQGRTWELVEYELKYLD